MTRSADAILHHYRVERALADKIRRAPRATRAGMYPAIYDELFAAVPDHPQHTKTDTIRRDRLLRDELRFVAQVAGRRRRCDFMEIGAGDCAFSAKVAEELDWEVIAVDVSQATRKRVTPRQGYMEMQESDGTDIPTGAGAIDVAYSYQLMEHLHPDDAATQLINIRKSLRPGGIYICATPNRTNGPHDVSKHFDEVATGLHLKEYTIAELADLFYAVGFLDVESSAGARGAYVKVPLRLAIAAERLLWTLPLRLRRMLASTAPLRALLGIRIVGTN